MRQLAILLFICLSLGCATTKNSKTNSRLLNGTWVPNKQEIGGRQLPQAVFEKQRLIIRDSTYTVIAESVDKGVVQYKENKMDIYGKEGVNTGKHFTAIYKMENEVLTICYNLLGDRYPENFETTGKPLYFPSVFNREPIK